MVCPKVVGVPNRFSFRLSSQGYKFISVDISKQEQEFHYTLIKASQNQFLMRLVRSMDFRWVDLLARDAYPIPDDETLPTHHQIAESIKNGDSVMAENRARRHVSFYKLIGVESKLGPTVYWGIQP